MPARGVCSIYYGFFHVVRFLCVLSALFPWPTTVEAQAYRVATAAHGDFPGDFQRTVQQSGLIFEGTVTSIRCEFGGVSGRTQQPQTYRISFQVKQGVRGVPTGALLTIREWAGLWPPAQGPRYRVGERAFLFLYPISHAGLTSTAGGRNGKLVVNGGEVALPRDWIASLGLGTTPGSKLTALQPGRVPVAWLVQHVAQADRTTGGVSR